MLYNKILFFLCFLMPAVLLGRSPLKTPRSLTTSIIIPCYHRHAPHLYSLLQAFEAQTVLPDEVIISLSECNKVDPFLIEQLQHSSWAFPLILLTFEETQYAGINRNKACEHASSDIFILQDADDIPYPQRVEIIKYFFENYDIDFLMHQFFLITDPKIPLAINPVDNVKKIRRLWLKNILDIPYDNTYANGHIALTKKIFQCIKWNNHRRGQDSDFNKTVYKKFPNKILLIETPLVAYRRFFSSKDLP